MSILDWERQVLWAGCSRIHRDWSGRELPNHFCCRLGSTGQAPSSWDGTCVPVGYPYGRTEALRVGSWASWRIAQGRVPSPISTTLNGAGMGRIYFEVDWLLNPLHFASELSLIDFCGRALELGLEGEWWLLIRLCRRVAFRLFLRRYASEWEAEWNGRGECSEHSKRSLTCRSGFWRWEPW